MERPSYLQIEPVGQCNLRCKMCPVSLREDGPADGPPAFMDFEVFKRLLDQAPGLLELCLAGLGEPLLHPRLFEMTAYATAKGIKVVVVTNMTLLSPRRAESCVQSRLDTLQISIDGATAPSYETLRVRSRMDRVFRNLAHLIDTKRKLKSKTPHLHFTTVVMRRNLHELPALVRLARLWGIRKIYVHQLVPDPLHDPGSAENTFVKAETLLGEAPERVKHFFQQAREAAAELQIALRLPPLVPKSASTDSGLSGPHRCDKPWKGAYLSYQGLASPCCMVSAPDRLNFGNMASDGVDAIWNSREYEAFRAQVDSDAPPEICRSCPVYRGTF